MTARTLALTAVVALGALHCADTSEIGVETDELVELSIAPGYNQVVNLSLDEETAVIVTLDCGVPKNPDKAGNYVMLHGADFVLPKHLRTTTRSAFWQWAGTLGAGSHPLKVVNNGGDGDIAKCKLDMRKQPERDSREEDVCTSWNVFRSYIGFAAHIPVGDTDAIYEAFPSSGNHWGAWAPWNTVYERPVLQGFYLHNLEHGGAVLSYKCESPDESPECKDAEQALVALAEKFGSTRFIVTPDPKQVTMFAIRTWRWGYASDCLDPTSALDFLKTHFRKGREDINADPPIPFDPTTTEDVPCENLMAAPDGC